MITIPTGDLVGVLADVVPFASPDEEAPTLCCVRLEWDGARLHAMATDRYRIGWSQWGPEDDPPEGGDVQEDLFTSWGGGDEPWAITIGRGDAKDVVSNYKLPVKERWCPLSVEFVDGQLRVQRSRDTGYSAITMVLRGLDYELDPGEVAAGKVRQILATADRVTPVRDVAYSAKWMADFAKVRPAGPLELTFTRTLTLVQIGERFTGAIMPASRGKDGDPDAVAAQTKEDGHG